MNIQNNLPRSSVNGQVSMVNVKAKGFTLLELLIVISIIAILSVILIVALNPAETLRKARDTQRISDLASLKTALGIYVTTKTTPQLDGTSGTVNDKCDEADTADEELWVSALTANESPGETIDDATPPSGWTAAATSWQQPTTTAVATLIDGTGWIPVNLSSITGGSPISNLPMDPINDLSITTRTISASTKSAVTNSAQTYRYACSTANVVFELNAVLESAAFGYLGDDDRALKDGGNNIRLYEVGTDLTILPSTDDF